LKVDFESGVAHCQDHFKHDHLFDLNYDKLVLAPGGETNTFGVKGVKENPKVFFLKQLEHSRAIRNRLIECFERASSPSCSEEEARRLLTFVIVGGGPTSVEFAGELHDFVKKDVLRWFPDLHSHVTVTLVEAGAHLLGNFNSQIVDYTETLFKKRQVDVLTGVSVKVVHEDVAHLSNGIELPFGLMVWSTGV
jgi:NADH dehydrogenase FAD-containing subunit